MTKYAVTWCDEAEAQLAAMWVQRKKSRAAITSAAHAIDAELQFAPTDKGTPQPDGLRSLHVPPLQVLYVVRPSDRVVKVVMARFLQPPSTPGSNGPGAGVAP